MADKKLKEFKESLQQPWADLQGAIGAMTATEMKAWKQLNRLILDNRDTTPTLTKKTSTLTTFIEAGVKC